MSAAQGATSYSTAAVSSVEKLVDCPLHNPVVSHCSALTAFNTEHKESYQEQLFKML